MTAFVIPQRAGLWRRTLLVEADGSRDPTPGVLWLQGETAYVDSRGFAGPLQQTGNVFEWHRDVDLEAPSEFPDVGAMHWDGGTLVETGVHADYTEHWVRDDVEAVPCWGYFLSSEDGNGVLLRVGELFGWAGGGTVAIGPVGGSQWDALAIEMSENRIQANGVHWTIERSEGNVNP